MKRPLLRIAGVGAAFGLVSSCSLFEPTIRNVLLISVDTLRADYLSSYGFPRETTPNIDAVAREGVVFKNVVSPVPITLPAHTSMLTGTIPPYHGMHDNLSHRLPDSNTTLAELLKEEGLTTGAIVSSFVLDSKFNLSQGFDTYNDRFEEEHKILYLSERKGDETTRLAEAWLEDHREERFFLFLHYYDPHDGYQPPEPFASEFSDDPYAGEVAFADHCIGRVVEKLKELGLFDSTLILITGDHGEMLGEHGELTHGYFIYRSALRVPLIIRVPGGGQPREAGRLASLIDIVPTIGSLMGFEVPEAVQGEDLSPWLNGEAIPDGERELYAESFTPTRYYGASSLFGLITEKWKYIQTTRPELYDLEDDRDETVNLIEKEPRRAEVFKIQLKQVLGTQRDVSSNGVELDEASRRRLESLGYLGRVGGGDEIDFEQNKEDPKDLIEFYRSDQKLAELIDEELYDEARSLGTKMLGERPRFVEGHLQLARIATAQGDDKAAIGHYERAIEIDPDRGSAHYDLANILRTQDELDRAIEHYRRSIELAPDFKEAKDGLARALAARGRLDEAVAHWRETLDVDAHDGEAHLQLGLTLASQGKTAEAGEHFRQAVAIDPGSPDAHLALASLLLSEGELEEAIDHFRKALQANPDVAEVHDRLGLALREQGRQEAAIREFNEALRLKPDLAIAHHNLGVALKQQGNPEQAEQHYRQALAMDPGLAQAHNNLGSLLGSQDKLAEAIRHFRHAVEIEPDHSEAHNNLGLALRMTGDHNEALRHFRAAVRQRPDWPEPLNEMAWILATHPDAGARKPREAVTLAERAAELTRYQNPFVLDTLAAAYAANGEFDRAVSMAEKAVAQASSARAGGLAREIGRRLELYRQKKPFQEPVRAPTR